MEFPVLKFEKKIWNSQACFHVLHRLMSFLLAHLAEGWILGRSERQDLSAVHRHLFLLKNRAICTIWPFQGICETVIFGRELGGNVRLPGEIRDVLINFPSVCPYELSSSFSQEP